MGRGTLIVLAALAFIAVSCAGGTRLTPVGLDAPPAITGTYTVYLYSSRHHDGGEGMDLLVGAVAVLDEEGDAYDFEMRTPGFNYQKIKGLSGPEAVDTAEVFLNRFKGRNAYKRIDVEGKTVGYEISLKHKAWIYKRKSILADYRLTEDNKIRVTFGPGSASSASFY